MVRLSEIATFNPEKPDMKDAAEVSFVPMEQLQCGFPTITAIETKRYGEVKTGYKCFANGDVILARITPCFENGKSGIAEGLKNGTGFGSTEYIVIRPNTAKVDPRWVYYHISSTEFIERGKEWMTGTSGRQRLLTEYVTNYLLPLPDLAEQERILAAIAAEYSIIMGNKMLAKKYRARVRERLETIGKRPEKTVS
jgi:type I restriction enzyme M protein